MNRLRWLFMLCLAWTLPTMAADMRERTFQVGADANAQGEVAATQSPATAAKPIAALLDLALKRWRFVPAQHDGKAAAAHTFIHARLIVTPEQGGKYAAQTTYISHGPSWSPSTSPNFPVEAVHALESGIVAVTGNLQPDGKIMVTDAQSRIDGSNGSSYLLKKAAIDWFWQHTFILETVEDQPVPAQAHAYVTFRLNPEPGPHSSTSKSRLSEPEKKLVLAAGFKAPHDGSDPASLDISTVLQASDVRPITLHI